MTDNRTTAKKWASSPLTFENARKKRDRKKLLRFCINHRTHQAMALQEYATTDDERGIAEQLWREVDELKREWKELT